MGLKEVLKKKAMEAKKRHMEKKAFLKKVAKEETKFRREGYKAEAMRQAKMRGRTLAKRKYAPATANQGLQVFAQNVAKNYQANYRKPAQKAPAKKKRTVKRVITIDGSKVSISNKRRSAKRKKVIRSSPQAAPQRIDPIGWF